MYYSCKNKCFRSDKVLNRVLHQLNWILPSYKNVTSFLLFYIFVLCWNSQPVVVSSSSFAPHVSAFFETDSVDLSVDLSIADGSSDQIKTFRFLQTSADSNSSTSPPTGACTSPTDQKIVKLEKLGAQLKANFSLSSWKTTKFKIPTNQSNQSEDGQKVVSWSEDCGRCFYNAVKCGLRNCWFQCLWKTCSAMCQKVRKASLQFNN